HSVHDARRAIHVHQLPAHQRDLLARGPSARPGPGARRRAATRETRQADRQRMTRLAARAAHLAGSPMAAITATVDRLRREGVDVVDFGAGEPDFATPAAIDAAARTALDQHFTKYTPVGGIAELRQAICDRYRVDYGVEYSPNEVIATAGGKHAL